MIRPLGELDRTALLELNNAHATELSWLTAERLDLLLSQSSLSLGVAPMQAALIAFDQASSYDGGNFIWFRERYRRFLYVDRVVVAAEARGQGWASRLYERVFAAAGADPVCCEVNIDPPNPASDAFHAALNFAPVGVASHGVRTVRYMMRGS